VPRIPRGQQAGNAYHVINRGNGRATVFHKSQDYEAFLSLLKDVEELGSGLNQKKGDTKTCDGKSLDPKNVWPAGCLGHLFRCP
jgi:hypothetical protein